MSSPEPYLLCIERSARRRSVTLRFDPESMRLRLLVPARMTGGEIELVLRRHRRWIGNQAARAALRRREAERYAAKIGGKVPFLGEDLQVAAAEESERPEFGVAARRRGGCIVVSSTDEKKIRSELVCFYLTEAEKYLPERVAFLAQRHGVGFRSIKISDAARRWGSCSGAGDLRLAWRLMFFPPEIIDGVAAHELAHRKVMNHSEAFYAEWSRMCPEYRKVRRFLNQTGGSYGFL